MGSAKVEDPPIELVGKESVEATWDSKCRRYWVEIKTPILPSSAKADGLKKNTSGTEYFIVFEFGKLHL